MGTNRRFFILIVLQGNVVRRISFCGKLTEFINRHFKATYRNVGYQGAPVFKEEKKER